MPYKYGGMNPGGFDCSGLTSFVYKKAAGLDLQRSAKGQANQGHRVSRPQPGDLLFFNTRGSSVSHVAIYLGGNSFIHAPRKGKRVEIVSLKNSYWRRRYLYSKSMI